MRMSVAIVVASVGMAIAAVSFTLPAQAQSRSDANSAARMQARSADHAVRPRVRIYRDSGRLDVSPRFNPGPNAVRECRAQLVQEFRPSGTVIVPRMDCHWVRG